jgi:tellurite resistance-related uncharacterized protein
MAVFEALQAVTAAAFTIETDEAVMEPQSNTTTENCVEDTTQNPHCEQT